MAMCGPLLLLPSMFQVTPQPLPHTTCPGIPTIATNSTRASSRTEGEEERDSAMNTSFEYHLSSLQAEASVAWDMTTLEFLSFSSAPWPDSSGLRLLGSTSQLAP